MSRQSDNPVCQSIEQQCEEDTCTAHKVWCCDQCFDMTPVEGVIRGHASRRTAVGPEHL